MMFEPQESARLFQLPPGCDFVGRLLDGLAERLAPLPPLKRAEVQVIVNTRRAARLLTDRMVRDARFDGLMPQIGVISDLTDAAGLPDAVPEARRMFWLARLVDGLLARDPTLAPRAARFDLASALGDLLDALQEAGVAPEELSALDVADHAAHWQISVKFVELLVSAWPELRAEQEGNAPDPAARARAGLTALLARWAEQPPQHPIIVAGSTGSRAGTHALMLAVAALPQGALVLPGHDAALPADLKPDNALGPEHPQYGLRRLVAELDVLDVPVWHGSVDVTPRARLISTSLRPAPVTDGWLEAAPALAAEVETALTGFDWLDAPAPREEAEAIAYAMREAVEAGQSVALVTPDRGLSRRVGAALDRWNILPDDSAGRPLHLTPPGVLLRLVAQAMANGLTPARLIELLKHPLVGGVGQARRLHLRRIGRLQLARMPDRRGVLDTPEVDWSRLADWAAAQREAEAEGWIDWIAMACAPLMEPAPNDCAAALHCVRNVAQALSLPDDTDILPLWQEEAGRVALTTLSDLEAASMVAGPVSAGEVAAILDAAFATEQVREAGYRARPGVTVLGTLEARMQQADLIILAGLNEGVWPARPTPDPWMSRKMRADLGLPMPERETGLAAHDYQNGASAPRVLVSRALRAEGAPTVASRWLIRLENLVTGLGEGGKAALAASKARGARLLTAAARLDRPQGIWPEPATRTAPAPPVAARPRALSVTRVETLIRDPYAIYAQKVLGLHELDSPGQEPDARVRGMVLHMVMERWVRAVQSGSDPRPSLERISQEVLDGEVRWPAIRTLWHARLMRIADTLVENELARLSDAHSVGFETYGQISLPAHDFTLTGTADRIDLTDEGRYRLYDYKSGEVPTLPQIRAFAQQLPLEKMIAEAGGFDSLGKAPVDQVAYLGLNSAVTVRALPGDSEEVQAVEEGITRLIASYDDPQRGYSPRSRPQFLKDYHSTYSLVSRYGEWGEEAEAETVEVGR